MMGDLEIFIPIVAIVATFSIPIIAILVHHQRKMAELIHSSHAQAAQPSLESQALRQEVAELRKLLHQQAIALDDIRSALPAASSEEERRSA